MWSRFVVEPWLLELCRRRHLFLLLRGNDQRSLPAVVLGTGLLCQPVQLDNGGVDLVRRNALIARNHQSIGAILGALGLRSNLVAERLDLGSKLLSVGQRAEIDPVAHLPDRP